MFIFNCMRVIVSDPLTLTISLNTFTYVDLCSIPCPNQADQENQARLEEVDQGLDYPQALLIGLF